MKTGIIFGFIALSFTFSSCKKEIVKEYVPIEYSWKLDSAVYGDRKILLNSVQLNDSVLAVANSYMVKYIYTNNLNYTFNIHIPGGNLIYNNGLVRPSLNKTVTAARVDKDRLAIFKTYMPEYMGGLPVFFSPTYSQSTTTLQELPRATLYNSGYPVIKSKYILAPYETDFRGRKATFSLITVDNSQFCNITSTKDIVADNPSPAGFYDGPYYSWAFYDKFFITYYGQTFCIDTLGNTKSLLSDTAVFHGKYIEQMFQLDNHLFALGWGTMFISNDQGESWHKFSDINGGSWGYLQYYNMGNDVYAFYLSQLAKVTLSNNTLSLQELDNNGLEGNQITSINKCGKYAFVTTLSGLFYRDTATLNTPKK